MHEPSTENPVEARAAVPDEVHALLVTALSATRWFPAKGAAGHVEPHAVIDLVDPQAEARVEVRLLRLPTGTLLQVPLTFRTAGPDGGRGDQGSGEALGGVLGTVDDEQVRDGCHDPAFVRAWLAAASAAGATAGDGPGPDADGTSTMRVLSGEQSNTSVLLPDAVPPAILKVFRGLTTGPSADVEVPLALSGIGWPGVPRPLAWLAGSWPAADGSAARDVGHLGVLSALVVGAQDGFELACRYAREGSSFADLAHDLGRTTAQMHRALRSALPLDPSVHAPHDGTPAQQVVGVLRERAAAAFAAVPELAVHTPAVEEVLAALGAARSLPSLQRVHGDYHLGQVLHSAAGWSVLDFEGEPQASTAERTRPDLALRDLAGMLRSIDYAAAVGEAADPAWALDARAALVRGYDAGSADPDDATPSSGAPGTRAAAADVDGSLLLRALELDKALYEAVYESRNRPAWLPIPLRAVERLLTAG